MKAIRFAFPAIAIVFLGLAFSGQEIKTENGVIVVSNPIKPVMIGGKSVQLTLKENLRIGDKADEKDTLFADIRAARVDTEGRIIVLDWKDFKIKIFDNKGKIVRSFGKKGQGPEEWGQAQDISLTPENNILVFDPGNKRLGLYTQDGKGLKEIPLGKLFPDPARMDAEGNIWAVILSRDSAKKTYQLIKYDLKLNPLATSASVSAEAGPAHNNVYPEWLVFEQYGKGGWIWAFTAKYELMITNSQGIVKKKIVKDYRPTKVSESRKKDYIERVKKSMGEDAAYILPNLVFPSDFPPIVSFRTDEKGRVFVRTYETDAQGNVFFDVFDPEGRYISRFPHPDQEKLFAVRNDEAYFLIQENEEGLPLIKRYQLLWK
jgi:hypothetical protein